MLADIHVEGFEIIKLVNPAVVGKNKLHHPLETWQGAGRCIFATWFCIFATGIVGYGSATLEFIDFFEDMNMARLLLIRKTVINC